MNAEMMVVDAREDARAWNMNVYLDGEDVTAAAYRAMLPVQPSVEADGWVDRYALDVDGRVWLDPKKDRIAEVPRAYGLTRWEHK